MSDPTQGAAETPDIKWTGLSPSIAIELEQRLTRIGYRVSLHNRTTDKNERHLGMLGILLDDALSYLRQMKVGVDVLTNDAIAKFLDISPAGFGNWRRGRPTKSRAWVDRAQRVLKLLFCGDESCDAVVIACWERVNNFLFRDQDDHGIPKYISELRRHVDGPWSRTEIANEIRWFVREISREPRGSGQLVFVSGGGAFLQTQDHTADTEHGKLKAPTQEAIAAGVPVTFIFDPDSAAAEIANNIDTRYARADPARKMLELRPFSDLGPSFLNPAFQFAYFEAVRQSGTKKSLLLIRAREVDKALYPLTVAAIEPEIAAFKDWLTRVLSASKNPIPGSQVSSASGPVLQSGSGTKSPPRKKQP